MPHSNFCQKEIEVEIDILSLGKFLINRSSDKEYNSALLLMLDDLGVKLDDISEFFESQDSIEHIIGDRTFCG